MFSMVRVNSCAKYLEFVGKATLKKNDFVVVESPLGLELGVVEKLLNKEIKQQKLLVRIATQKFSTSTSYVVWHKGKPLHFGHFY